jgi:site-specific recombinase XerD
LNHSIKSLNRWNKFKDNGFKFQRYKEDKKPMKVPNTQEIHKMLNQCKGKNRIDKRNRTIILLLAKTGMRNKEICNLKLTDIDWQRKEITIRNSKHNKTRIIPIDDKMLFGRTYPSLKNYIKHWRMKTSKHYVFTTKKGRMTPNYLRRIIKIISQKAGIYWIHPHSFRHYSATNLLRAGVNIRVVQAIPGHSSIRTTGNYLHVIENDLHQAITNPHIEDPMKTRPYKIRKCLAKPLLM